MRFNAGPRLHALAAAGVFALVATLGLGSAPAIAGTAKCDAQFSAETKKVTVRCVHQGTGPAQCQTSMKLACESGKDSNWFYSFPLQPDRTRDLERNACIDDTPIKGIISFKVECQ